MIVDTIKTFLWPNIGIDLGSANTRIYDPVNGVVLDEPSAISLCKDTGQVLSVGKEAGELIGRTPRDVNLVCPVRGGCVADYNAAVLMLAALVERAMGARRHYRAAVSLPSSATPLDRRAVHDVCRAAGAVKVDMVDAGLSAAYGAGLCNDADGRARLAVDIGAGVTNVTAVAAGQIISSRSVVAGVELMDASIRDLVRGKYEMCLGELAAGEALRVLGVRRDGKEQTGHEARLSISGKHPVTGFAQTVEVTADDIHVATEPVLEQIAATIRTVIEETPPDVTADVCNMGLVLTGGGAMIEGVADQLQAKINLHVAAHEEPLHAVVRGIGLLFEDSDRLGRAALLPDKAASWENEENLAAG